VNGAAEMTREVQKVVERQTLDMLLASLGLRLDQEPEASETPDFMVSLSGQRIGVEITMYSSGDTVDGGRGRRQVESEWEKLRLASEAFRAARPELRDINVNYSTVVVQRPPDAWGRVSFLAIPLALFSGSVDDTNHPLGARMNVEVPNFYRLFVPPPMPVEGLDHVKLQSKKLNGVVHGWIYRAVGRRINGDRPAFIVERSAVLSRVSLTRAESSRARRAGRSDRPARAGWAALRQFRLSDIPLWGDRWSSGVWGERWWRPPPRRARAGFKECSAVQVRGYRKQAALKDQAFRGA
jgi:hypothetical protein